MTSNTKSPSCSEISLQAGEELHGTATFTAAYLLLEYPSAWGAKAFEDSQLPSQVKAQLDACLQATPASKILLIRRPASAPPNGVRFYVAITSETQGRLYAFRLGDYLELLKLDLSAILGGSLEYEPHRLFEPLFLVCSHGRRDPCCSRLGIPVFNALLDATKTSADPIVWQSSHVGGHRFAANLLTLPDGLLYGRVDASSALEIMNATRQRRIYLPNLRGRSAYSPAAQVAEVFLRRQLDLTDLDALRLEQARQTAEDLWSVHFEVPASGQRYTLQVRFQSDPQTVFESCQLDKRTPLVRYQVEISEI